MSHDQILFTKLIIPATPTKVLSRPRLILDDESARVVLVCAPAGYGKTTLVASWATANNRNVVWLSLDKADNDPVRFLMHFITAIQGTFPEFGGVVVDMLESAPPPPISTLMRSLVNQVCKLPKRLSLVLDDLHLLTDSSVHEAIAFLIDHQPDRLQIVITSRNDPPFSLAKIRAQRHLLEYRTTDLRFTLEEATLFCNDVMHIDLEHELVQMLTNRTEGWIAGLQLATISLSSVPDKSGFISNFSGDDRYVADFLLDEVLRSRGPDIQNFLLYTSVLERFNATLCDAVTERTDSRSMIDQIERNNLFVFGLDHQRNWYRYHHLFTALLKNRLLAAQPDMVNILRRRASRWFSQNNFISEAINYALLAEDFEFAADLMEQHGHQLFAHGKINAALALAGKLPDGLLAKRPILSMTCAWGNFYMDNLVGLDHHVSSVEKCLADCKGAPFGSKEGAMLGQVALLRGCHSAFTGKIEAAISYTKDALAAFSRGRTLYRAAATCLGAYYLVHGKLNEARTLLEENAEIAESKHNILIPITATLGLARLHLLQGRPESAKLTYEKAMRECAALGWQEYPACGILHIGLGELAYESNDLTAAEQYLCTGVEMTSVGMHYMNTWGRVMLAQTRLALGVTVDVISPHVENSLRKYAGRFVVDLPPLSAAIARLWLAQKYLVAVRQWSAAAQLPLTIPLAVGREAEYVVLVRFLIASHRLADAMELANCLWRTAEEGQHVAVMTELLVLKVLILQAEGDISEALAVLAKGVALAEGTGLLRVFLNEGEPVASLLRRLALRTHSASFTRRVLGQFAKTNPVSLVNSTRSLPSPLSKKEKEVVRHILSGASVQETAVAMFISPHTVSSHMKHIYSKLGVNSRSKAIDELHRLGFTK